jgi:hypothetical protein
MLSTAQLASMQQTLVASLPDLCSIEHVSLVSDGAGGTTSTAPISDFVSFRYAEVTDKREGFMEGDIIFGNPVWIFTFAAGTAIDVLDVIRPRDTSRAFEVQVVFNRSWEVDLRVICREKM